MPEEERWSALVAEAIALGAANASDARLEEVYKLGWERVRESYALLEPVLYEKIARAVREHVPEATALLLEATDQGGPGWVLRHVKTPNGPLDDERADALHDVDHLWSLLSDLGEFVSNETQPDPYELELPVTLPRRS